MDLWNVSVTATGVLSPAVSLCSLPMCFSLTSLVCFGTLRGPTEQGHIHREPSRFIWGVDIIDSHACKRQGDVLEKVFASGLVISTTTT
ncbi:hypothetical protein RRG08_019694 [Elysia crispata]|uniref:Uncharacterized protein n=1 Tax=Elysia crispata TaxID=231223 RepID=A0AAE1CLC8_9GAST|nr:hypothetical protein RRG08_019694 [Elysia crispata]